VGGTLSGRHVDRFSIAAGRGEMAEGCGHIVLSDDRTAVLTGPWRPLREPVRRAALIRR
jgi:hypothetical protein